MRHVAGALGLVTLVACVDPAPPTAPAPVAPTVEEAVRALLMGGGGICDDDRGCAVGASPLARGTCVLGTCFGLLTTDAPAARAVLAERIAALPKAVQDAAVSRMIEHLWRPTSMASVRQGSAAGLRAVARRRGIEACGEACDALARLRDEPDGALAAAGRHGLAEAGDDAARAATIVDLQQGSEHLRAAAARALGVALRRGRDDAAALALQAALEDRSPVLRRIAAEALAPHAADAGIAASLAAARRRHPADLGYVVDRGLAAQARPQEP